MRTVKGRVTLNGYNPPQYYTVINEYDGYPLTLGYNDFIIGYAVANGNTYKFTQESNITLFSGFSTPTGIITNGSYMYVANKANGTISKINLVTGIIENVNWTTGLSNP